MNPNDTLSDLDSFTAELIRKSRENNIHLEQALKRTSPKKDSEKVQCHDSRAEVAPTGNSNSGTSGSKHRPSILSYTGDFLMADDDENHRVFHSTAIGLARPACEGTFRAEPFRVPLNDKQQSSVSIISSGDDCAVDETLKLNVPNPPPLPPANLPATKPVVEKQIARSSNSPTKSLSGSSSPTKRRSVPAVIRHLPSESKIAQALQANEDKTDDEPAIMSVSAKKALFEQAMIKDTLAAEKAKNPRKFAGLPSDRFKLTESESDPSSSKKKKDNSPGSSPVNIKYSENEIPMGFNSSSNLTRQRSATIVRETLKVSLTDFTPGSQESKIETTSQTSIEQNGRMNIISSSSVYRQVCDALSTIDELSSSAEKSYAQSNNPDSPNLYRFQDHRTPHSFDDNNVEFSPHYKGDYNKMEEDMGNYGKTEYDEKEDEEEKTIYANYPPLAENFDDDQQCHYEAERVDFHCSSPDDNYPDGIATEKFHSDAENSVKRIQSIKGQTFYYDEPRIEPESGFPAFDRDQKITLLRSNLSLEDQRLKQAKRALSMCLENKIVGEEYVEAERLFLLQKIKCNVLKAEIAKWSGIVECPELDECARGKVTISNIVLPLNNKFLEFIFAENKKNGTRAHFFCMLRCGSEVKATDTVVFPHEGSITGKLHFNFMNPLMFDDLTSKWRITMSVYIMFDIPRKSDKHSLRFGSFLTPKRKGSELPPTHSKVDIHQMTSSFAEAGFINISLALLKEGNPLRLTYNGTKSSAFEGTVILTNQVETRYSCTMEGYLNAFYVSRGELGWYQVWVELCGPHLIIRKSIHSTDDIIADIDLRRCVSGGAIEATMEICARHNSFILLTKEDRTVAESELERPLKQGIRECAIRRNLFCAYDKEERTRWIEAIASSMETVRKWDSVAPTLDGKVMPRFLAF